MKHKVDAATSPRTCRRIGDGAFDELDVLVETIEILLPSSREVVEYDDLVSLADKVLNEVRSDEASAARDEIPHIRSG